MIEQILALHDEVESLKATESAWVDALGTYLSLPGLRGFWPFTAIDESGNVIDISGHGLEVSINGDPDINYHNNIVPYADFDATGDYYSRTDEAMLDISGADTGINSAIQGLTVGGWFKFNSLGANLGLISKGDAAGNQRGFTLQKNLNNVMSMFVTSDGEAAGNSATITTTGTVTTGVWYFAVGRFIASTSLDVWLDKEQATKTSSIPASIFNNSAALLIGSFNAGSALLDGQAALCFLCASALPNATIGSLYQVTRGLFGV